jgi:2-polyprenyl-3-methyl-5-hydroxy-6-metoxy-1,4-benzoquinol methylase
VVESLDLHGRRVLELGAGLGVPSLAAALGGADVLATDWAEDAVSLLRSNAERNGLALRAERVRWDEPEPIVREAPWDVVLGADLLYEARNAAQLLELLPRLGGEIVLAEPGRPFAASFLANWDVEELAERVYRLRTVTRWSPSLSRSPSLRRRGRTSCGSRFRSGRGAWRRCVRTQRVITASGAPSSIRGRSSST